jgi:hypothetical protein
VLTRIRESGDQGRVIVGAFFEVEKRRLHAATAEASAAFVVFAFAALMHFERFIEVAVGFFALEEELDFGALGAFGAEPPPELLPPLFAPPELDELEPFCSPVVWTVEESSVERLNAFTS